MSNVAPDETLDEKIDRVLNTPLDEKFLGAKWAENTCARFTPDVSRLELRSVGSEPSGELIYNEAERKKFLADYGVTELKTVRDLMRIPLVEFGKITSILGSSIQSGRTIIAAEQAFKLLMSKEFNVLGGMPLFDHEYHFYPCPEEAIKNFLLNQDAGAKLSMTFNLKSFSDSPYGVKQFSTRTNLGDDFADVVISTVKDSDRDFSVNIGGAKGTINKLSFRGSVVFPDLGVDVTRIGDNFTLNMVQRLG